MRALRPVFESMSDLSRTALGTRIAARANSSGQSRRRRTHRTQRTFQRTHCISACSAAPARRPVRPASSMAGSPKRRGSSLARRDRHLLRTVLNFAFTHLFPHPRRLEFWLGLLRLYQRSGLQRLVATALAREVARDGIDAAADPVNIFSCPRANILPAIGDAPRQSRHAQWLRHAAAFRRRQ